MGKLSWFESRGDQMFETLDMYNLDRDEAFLNITNTFGNTSYLYSVYEQCYKCPYIHELTISNNQIYKVDTTYRKLWKILLGKPEISSRISDQNLLCEFQPNFGEFGVYGLEVSNGGCDIRTLKDPVNIYFPILTAILICLGISLLALIVFEVSSIYLNMAPTLSEIVFKEDKPNKRLKSLDAFRGICIALMIFVNYGAGGYVELAHAVWNGFHLADSIFPAFMWIMGLCIPITICSAITKGVSKKGIFLNIIRRSCLLFLLGVVQNGIVYRQVRLLGVLQRFAVGYFVSATATLLFSRSLCNGAERKKFAWFADVMAIKIQWIIGITLIVVHTIIVYFLEVPNCTRGYLGPGGYHDDAKHMGCGGGAAGYIDELIKGRGTFSWPSTSQIYNSDPLDVSNLLSQLPSVMSVITGIQAGSTILHYKTTNERIKRWLVWGFVLLLLGGGLCEFSIDDGFLPINKSLWSTPYVCVASGISFIAFSLCYYVIDEKLWWSGKPFTFAGMNSIVLYVGHSIAGNCVPIRWIVNGQVVSGTHFLTMLENVWGTTVWVFIAYYLYKTNHFVSL